MFQPGRGDPEGLRRQLGVRQDVRLLVFAGRPAREKNVDVLLEAVARLGPDYHLLLIGAGAGAKPQANASFIGFQRDPREVARLLASCDAFIHANPSEPFGLATLEALACGLPIAGVASGGVAEIVDEEIGELAPNATPGALCEAIEALCRRDLAELSHRARERAVMRHDWTRTFEGLASLYGALTGRPADFASTPVAAGLFRRH